MRRIPSVLAALAAWSALVAPAAAQQPQPTRSPQNQDLWISINKPTARKVAVAVPDLVTPGTATLKSTLSDPFVATLRSDLEDSGAFSVADPPHYPHGFGDPPTPDKAQLPHAAE